MTNQAIDWDAICARAAQLGRLLEARGWTISTAESCTGGLIAGAITEIAGSSAWFHSSVVTYSNAAKNAMLGVPMDIFEQQGAVSEACVKAMATGALHHSGAQLALSISGIAGPGGATSDKPVGTVWMAWAQRAAAEDPAASRTPPLADPAGVATQVFHFEGDRRRVRELAVYQALRGTILRLDNAGS